MTDATTELCPHGIALDTIAADVRACYACYLKWKNIDVAPSATPSRHKMKDPPPRRAPNSYEKGIARDDRGVPILDADNSGVLRPVPIKRYNANRGQYEERARELRHTVPEPKD